MDKARLGLLATLAVLVGIVVTGGTAVVRTPPARAQVSTPCEFTFNFILSNGAATTCQVGSGVTQLTISAVGVQGGPGGGSGGAGGAGGSVTATVPVVPGETLTVAVGGAGASGGFNGGGTGGVGNDDHDGEAAAGHPGFGVRRPPCRRRRRRRRGQRDWDDRPKCRWCRRWGRRCRRWGGEPGGVRSAARQHSDQPGHRGRRGRPTQRRFRSRRDLRRCQLRAERRGGVGGQRRRRRQRRLHQRLPRPGRRWRWRWICRRRGWRRRRSVRTDRVLGVPVLWQRWGWRCGASGRRRRQRR